MKSRLHKYSLTFALLISVASFFITFALAFQSIGLDHGLRIGEIESEETLQTHGIELVKFSVGEGTYQYLARQYGWLSASFLVVSGCVLLLMILEIRLSLWLAIISGCALASVVIGVVLRGMFFDKYVVVEWFYDSPRNSFAKITLAYDWILLICIFSIVITLVPNSILMFKALTQKGP